MKVDVNKYRMLCQEICIRSGLSKEMAEDTARILVRTDMMGTYTHGTLNLYPYMNKIKAGGIDKDAVPTVEKEGPAFAIVDGHNAMPTYNGCYGLRLAMKKARKVGVSYVGIKNSGHYGASGSYAVEAAEKGFIAISLSNTLCNMNVPGAKGALIGNSPFCYAIPVPSRHPVCLDIATSTAAAMKVLQVEARGGECPPDWIVDNDGNPITKPENGNWILSPIGGHKGYGISFLIEVLCAALSGGNVLNVGLWTIPEIVPEVSHSFILIDVAQITSLEDFSLRMLNAIHQLENAEPTVPGQKVYAPGDPAWENYDRATLLGLDLPDNIVHNMSLLAQETGLDLATCCAE